MTIINLLLSCVKHKNNFITSGPVLLTCYASPKESAIILNSSQDAKFCKFLSSADSEFFFYENHQCQNSLDQIKPDILLSLI